MSIPLAEILRPKKLEDYIGQYHLTGLGSILRNMSDSGRLHSMIFWGPPGTGKTTLAIILASSINSDFIQISAISAGVKDIRAAIDKAKSNIENHLQSPILFIDEIHRFNKAQQDALLASVEKGEITLIGATTENPSFEVISPLLSRCQIYILKELEKKDLEILIERAFTYYREKYKDKLMDIKSTDLLLALSGGDARKLYNIIELTIESQIRNQKILIDDEIILKSVQTNLSRYDKSGEQHYDTISAFIKAIRGSDPDAAVYYLARMVQGGEAPEFICRRMVVLAAEDIGLANPNALLLANTCFDAVHKIGYPEARIIMSEVAIYLACSAKSNSAYTAIEEALSCVRTFKDLSIPLHIRNAPTKLMKDIGYGKDYKYAHNYEGNFVYQNYLPEEIKTTKFYFPQNNENEVKIKERLNKIWKTTKSIQDKSLNK